MRKSSSIAVLLGIVLSFSALAQDSDVADNLINEPSFENTVNAGVFGDYTFMVDIDPATGQWNETTGWAGSLGSIDITGVPGDNFISFTTPYGSRAVRISTDSPNRQWWWPPIAFARPNFRTEPAWFGLASIDRVAVSPGDEVYASARIYTDAPLLNGQFGMIKVAFFDENGLDISPSAISQGEFDGLIGPLQCSEFPGAISSLKLDGGSAVNEWLKAQVQATAAIVGENEATDTLYPTCKDWTNDSVYNPVVFVNAPPGAVEMNIFLFNIDPNLTFNPIYFDDVYLGILEQDDDSDRIENRVDSDPINSSVDFSDGVTSGTVLSDIDGILAIDDSTDPAIGVTIVADPGSGTAARLRLCDSLASIRVRPNTELDVTCGSVILDVADGSEPVELEITINGETAVVTVPANNLVTYDDEGDVIDVDSSSSGDAVTFEQGGTTIAIAPGEELEIPSIEIDVKPGDESNCLNINGTGVIPVAILGSDTLDVASISRSSLDFDGLDVRVRGNDAESCGIEDVNGDGYGDLVCHFEDDPQHWTPGSGFATLRGNLIGGDEISGSDNICIVP